MTNRKIQIELAKKTGVDGTKYGNKKERTTRIELVLDAWEAPVLPLNHARTYCKIYYTRFFMNTNEIPEISMLFDFPFIDFYSFPEKISQQQDEQRECCRKNRRESKTVNPERFRE